MTVFASASRRMFLKRGAAGLLIVATPRVLRAAVPRFRSNPFLLGVASGYPTSHGFVLWTRLITSLAEPKQDLADDAIPVLFEVATDDRFRAVVAKGTDYATPDVAHSVHVEVAGLRPGRDYWYRFTAGGVQSPVGHTRTAPAADANPERLRIAVASCQKYESGYFTAYRHMCNDHPDLIVHVGDYIYEYVSHNEGASVRGDGSGPLSTLDDYRARYALYKSDADLQAAHAACAWLVTWDDHEVANDYAGDASYAESGDTLLARRAAAYRAYYEHMPLPRSAMPTGSAMHLYAKSTFGKLAQIHMLDSRQYRSPLACLGADAGSGPGAHCAELFDEARTMLGAQQEAWLRDTLMSSHARWNVLAQGTPMTYTDWDPSHGVSFRRDQWDGYPAARQRLLDALAASKASNPIAINGDIHAFQVANLHRRANDPRTPVVASEFTTTSISSGGFAQSRLDANKKNNPNILFSDSRHRGYLLLDFSAQHLRADLITVETVKRPAASRGMLASFVVESGKLGSVRG